jgi:hypothetical protein
MYEPGVIVAQTRRQACFKLIILLHCPRLLLIMKLSTRQKISKGQKNNALIRLDPVPNRGLDLAVDSHLR